MLWDEFLILLTLSWCSWSTFISCLGHLNIVVVIFSCLCGRLSGSFWYVVLCHDFSWYFCFCVESLHMKLFINWSWRFFKDQVSDNYVQCILIILISSFIFFQIYWQFLLDFVSFSKNPIKSNWCCSRSFRYVAFH